MTAKECEVLSPAYPCFSAEAFTINTVVAPAASTARDWDVAAGAWWLLALLVILKLASWALTAILLAGITGILRKS